MQGRSTFRFHSGHDGKPWGRRAEVDEALSNGHLCPFLLATTSCMGSKGTGGRPLRRLRLPRGWSSLDCGDGRVNRSGQS